MTNLPSARFVRLRLRSGGGRGGVIGGIVCVGLALGGWPVEGVESWRSTAQLSWQPNKSRHFGEILLQFCSQLLDCDDCSRRRAPGQPNIVSRNCGSVVAKLRRSFRPFFWPCAVSVHDNLVETPPGSELLPMFMSVRIGCRICRRSGTATGMDTLTE